MLPYVFMSLFVFIGALFKKNFYFLFFLFIVMFLLTTTYYNGSDWRSYELVYNGDISADNSWGIGFTFIIEIFKFLGFSFNAMLLITKMIVCLFVFVFICKNSINIQLSFAVFLYFVGYGLFIDNPFRQMLAVPFFLFFLSSILKNEKIKAILFLSIGALFHPSVIFFTPVVFLTHIRMNTIVSIFFMLFCYIITSSNLIFIFVDFIGSFFPLVAYYARHYLTGSVRLFSLSTLIYVVFFLVFIYEDSKHKKIFLGKGRNEDLIRYNIFYLLSYSMIIIVILSLRIPDILRINYYLGIPFAIYVSYFSFQSRFIVLFLGFILSSNIILTEYKYIPYTNYIYSYIFGDLKSYNYRYMYHINYHNI